MIGNDRLFEIYRQPYARFVYGQRFNAPQDNYEYFRQKASPYGGAGGGGFIAGILPGVLTVDGVPAARQIELRIRSHNRRVIATTWSDPNSGTYRFDDLNPSQEYDLIARDHNRVYSDIIIPALKPWPYAVSLSEPLRNFYHKTIVFESEIIGGAPPYTLSEYIPDEGFNLSIDNQKLVIEGEITSNTNEVLTFTIRDSDSHESTFSTIISDDPYWTSTISLLPMTGPDGSTVVEDVFPRHTWTVRGGARISDNETPLFGQSSLYLNGTNAYLRNDAIASELANLNTFTVEVWVLKRGPGSERGYIMAFNTSSGGNTILIGDGTVNYDSDAYSFDELPIDNKWHHFALSVEGGIFRVFVDGMMVHETSHSVRINSSDRFSLGQEYDNNNPTNFLEGNLGYFRATKAARYTQSFIPPEAPFPGF